MTQKLGPTEGFAEPPEEAAEALGLPALPPGEVLLVIIGAGASYDCIPINEAYAREQRPAAPCAEPRPFLQMRPPLTKDLASPTVFYNELASRYPACRPVLSELRRRLGPATGTAQAITLEEALADYAAGREVDPLVGRHLAAIRFYLRDLLWESTEAMLSPVLTGGVTNYTELVRRCYRWARSTDGHVCFINFNYDFLLEQACADHGWLVIDDMGTYTADRHASVLKPHGSVRWVWVAAPSGTWTDRAQVDQGSIESGEPVDPGALHLTTVADPSYRPSQAVMDTDRRWPALALPMRGKTGFVWPAEQRARLDSLQGRVRRLLTVGWRALEPHFTPLLQPLVMSRSRAVTVMGGPFGEEDAIGTRDELQLADPAQRRSIDYQLTGTGFSRFLDGDGDRLDWLLEEPIDWPPPW